MCDLHDYVNDMQVCRGHQQADSTRVLDFCDSPKAKEHHLFSFDPRSLQILLYFDEVELCNPLGASRKKHKLGM